MPEPPRAANRWSGSGYGTSCRQLRHQKRTAGRRAAKLVLKFSADVVYTGGVGKHVAKLPVRNFGPHSCRTQYVPIAQAGCADRNICADRANAQRSAEQVTIVDPEGIGGFFGCFSNGGKARLKLSDARVISGQHGQLASARAIASAAADVCDKRVFADNQYDDQGNAFWGGEPACSLVHRSCKVCCLKTTAEQALALLYRRGNRRNESDESVDSLPGSALRARSRTDRVSDDHQSPTVTDSTGRSRRAASIAFRDTDSALDDHVGQDSLLHHTARAEA